VLSSFGIEWIVSKKFRDANGGKLYESNDTEEGHERDRRC